MNLNPKPIKPSIKKVIAFFDGQNLFKRINQAFGYNLQFPNYDPLKLTEEICKSQDKWELKQVRFYTGIFRHQDNPKLHKMWTDKLNITNRRAITNKGKNYFYKFTTDLKTEGGIREKGIDVRIALDIVRLAINREYDVGLIFSQDKDLEQAINDVKDFNKNPPILATVYPKDPNFPIKSLNKTMPITFDKTLYEQCIDTRNYS